MSELKPCPNPWCEGLEDIEHREGGFFRVGCVCGVAGPAATDEATAIKLWNTRAMADPDTLRLREAVSRAAETFERYAQLHRCKGTPEGFDKARANEVLGQEMRAALTTNNEVRDAE